MRFAQRAVSSLVALLLCAILGPKAQAATPISTSPYYLNVEATDGGAGVTFGPFTAAAGYCENPQFGSAQAGSGDTFSIDVENTDASRLDMGYSTGDIPGSADGVATGTSYSGLYVHEGYTDTSGTFHADFFPIASPAPSGTDSFEDIHGDNTDYHTVYINNTEVATNIYEASNTNTAMYAELQQFYESGYSKPTTFPSFLSGAECYSLETYTTQWYLWPGGKGLLTNAPPPDSSSAHATWVNSGTSNAFSIYPN